MKTQYKRFFTSGIVAFFGLSCLFSQEHKEIIQAIKSEVDRNKSELKVKDLQPPFYIRYVMFDNEYLEVSASGGSISESNTYRTRDGLPFVLVGDFSQNNMGFVGGPAGYNYPERISLDNSGIATSVWATVDKKYKQAAVEFELKKVALEHQKKAGEENNVPCFENTTPPNLLLAPATTNMDQGYWENYLKKGSEVFNKYPELITSNVDLLHRNTMAYYYDTENGQYAVPVPYYRLRVTLSTQASDGQMLSNEWYFEHSYFELMPDLKSFISECEQFAKTLLDLRNAPLVTETYSGPVLFEDYSVMQAVQQEFFLNQWLLTRNKVINSAGTTVGSENELESMIGRKVMSRSLNLVSLSGTETYNGTRLDGYYPMDYTGIAPDKELFLVEKGVLKTLLSGRTPTTKVPESNGHARFSFFHGITRVMPGNIHLYSDEAVSLGELKQKLIDAAKEEDYDYTYIIRRLQDNRIFLLYRVTVADGKEELVRGGVIRGLNSKSFNKILGASKEELMENHAALGQITTLIVPRGVLFDNIEVIKDNFINKTPPYIVPKPN